MPRNNPAPNVLIPARGGSKGIRRKNLQEVCGKPLVVRSIQAAQNSRLSGNIYVSTDDEEIAIVAKENDAYVIDRPPELATDTTSSELVINHFLESCSISDGKLILVQPTTPFLLGSDIDQVVESLNSYDSSLTVFESHVFLWRQENLGEAHGINHNHLVRLRRQDVEHSEYIENGAAFGMDVEGFRLYRHRFFGRIGLIVMPQIRSVEIDTPEDLVIANAVGQVIEH